MTKNADIRDNALFVMAGLILVNVFWGASSIAAKEALQQLNAIEIVTIRFTIALLIVFGMAVAMKKWDALKIDPRDIPTFILLSLSNVSIGFILQVESLNYTTVTNFSMEFNLATFFIMLMGALLLGERLTRRKLAGAGVAFGGAFLIISGGHLDLASTHLLGDAMGVGSAIAFGLFTIASKKISSKYGLMTILLYTFFFGVLELLPFYVLGTPMTPLTSLSALSWSSLLFLAVLCSVFCFFVYTHGLSRLRASDVAMSIYVTPLAGILLAVLLLGEKLTTFTVFGAGLILAGMYLTQQELRIQQEPLANAPEKRYTPIAMNE